MLLWYYIIQVLSQTMEMTSVKNDQYFFLLLCYVMSKRNYIKADVVFWLVTVLTLVQE